MAKIWAWIASEWAQTSTHVWLATELGIAVTYINGQVSGSEALAGAIGALVAIIVPQGKST